MEKQRTVASIVLIAVGAVLLLYGLSSRANVASSSEEQSQTQGHVASASESSARQEVVAKDEVKLEESSQAKKPDTVTKKAPAACPT